MQSKSSPSMTTSSSSGGRSSGRFAIAKLILPIFSVAVACYLAHEYVVGKGVQVSSSGIDHLDIPSTSTTTALDQITDTLTKQREQDTRRTTTELNDLPRGIPLFNIANYWNNSKKSKNKVGGGQKPTTTTSPTPSPSSQPTSLPTSSPTPSPSSQPTSLPTASPTPSPSSQPTSLPTASPTPSPSNQPTSLPTASPTPSPSNQPVPLSNSMSSPHPSSPPSSKPTRNQSSLPRSSLRPSFQPKVTPSSQPTTNSTSRSIFTSTKSAKASRSSTITTAEAMPSFESSSFGLWKIISLALGILICFVALGCHFVRKGRENNWPPAEEEEEEEGNGWPANDTEEVAQEEEGGGLWSRLSSFLEEHNL